MTLNRILFLSASPYIDPTSFTNTVWNTMVLIPKNLDFTFTNEIKL